MTPIQETEIDMEKLEKRTMPSLTWRINEEKAEVRGETDELDAMRQAVSKILQTERYRYCPQPSGTILGTVLLHEDP